ncbi:IMPACT family protein [Alteromonas flava]|uniref:IMPACT family protein n=1 Tax=Alteromonas flava TaxID=2048003 RepID=UPI000C288B3C|nr:YigZ family protein [Alteromonas flava]
MSYSVPVQAEYALLEIKKSLFHTLAAHASDRQMAMQWLQDMRDRYPDARHHCWAYLLGRPDMPSSVAMSDDGEPSGTAGKPILNVLQHNPIGDVVVIVSRYFGGIKLGAGGLVRAYSAAAQQVIERVPTQILVPTSRVRIKADFKHEQYLRHWIEQHGGSVQQCDYTTAVSLEADIATAELEQLASACASFNLDLQVKE